MRILGDRLDASLAVDVDDAVRPVAGDEEAAIVGQCDTTRRPPEQGPLGLNFKPLDLLAHRRLRQVEPLRGAVETATIGDGNEGAQ